MGRPLRTGPERHAGDGRPAAAETSAATAAGWDPRFSPPGMNNNVYALAVDGNGVLYAGGDFTAAGGVGANHIARWDGTSWTPISSGMNRSSLPLATGASGTVYASGGFDIVGGVLANHIARWDGTNWSALGPGLNIATTLAVAPGGTLYAGGSFSIAGGNAAGPHRTLEWHDLVRPGSGMNSDVNAVAVDGNGILYAAGASRAPAG